MSEPMRIETPDAAGAFMLVQQLASTDANVVEAGDDRWEVQVSLNGLSAQDRVPQILGSVRRWLANEGLAETTVTLDGDSYLLQRDPARRGSQHAPGRRLREATTRVRPMRSQARGAGMTTVGWRRGSMKLSDIRNDLENNELTPTQRKDAFEHLSRWLGERPDDAEAKGLWARHQDEFGRGDADAPLARDPAGEGFGALSEAERRSR